MQVSTVSANVMSPDAKSAAQPRLTRAAHEFEAQMMKELLAPLAAPTGMDGEEDGGSSGALGAFATESLGRSLSMSGGFGIADRLIHSLSHSGNSSKTAEVTSATHGNNCIGCHE